MTFSLNKIYLATMLLIQSTYPVKNHPPKPNNNLTASDIHNFYIAAYPDDRKTNTAGRFIA